MIRIFDFLFALIGIISLMPLMLLIVLILYLENKSPFFFQERIGRNLKNFTLIKFRTMRKGTQNCATHLVDSSRITPLGAFLRRTKLDEIPQLWNVLKGEMSFVGPRPALYNQKDLIKLRTKNSVHKILPGITGLAQINGRDKLSIKEKALFDIKYLKDRTLVLDIKIILITLKKMLSSSGVTH